MMHMSHFHSTGFKISPRFGRYRQYRGLGFHEFQVLADSGEDVIVHSNQSDYAANLEFASAKAPTATARQTR